VIFHGPLAGHKGVAGGFVIAEWKDEGGESDSPRYIAPLHRHQVDDEAWYILEGRMRFRMDERELEAGPGELVLSPPGVAHTFWNPGPGPVRYLLVMTPNISAMLNALHELPDRNRESVAELFARFGCELL
jgi:mannose-6-phosphate isomerase-like protein (cupin superfamily)